MSDGLGGTEREPLLLNGAVLGNRESVAASEFSSGYVADPEARTEDSAFSVSLFASLLGDSVPGMLSSLTKSAILSLIMHFSSHIVLYLAKLSPDCFYPCSW